MLANITKILDFVKFEHSIFALPFAYSGAFLAYDGIPGLITLVWVTLAAVGARSAAMSLNRVIDYEIDALNPRTRERHIPRGDIRVGEALLFTLLSFMLLFISAHALNPLCFILAPILVLMFVVYPYLKRYTCFSHVFLGLCLGLAPVGGWLAITGTFDGALPSFIMLASVVFWVAGFDIIYAIQDLDFDRKTGLYSIPGRFGLGNALKIALLFHALSVVFLILLHIVSGRGFMFLAGVGVISLLLLYEQWVIRSDMKKIQAAFFNVNALVSVCFLLFTALDIIL